MFWKKEQNLIPPVGSEASASRSTNSTSPRPSYRSNASTYVPSRDGDLSGGGSAYSSRTAVNTNPSYRAPGSEAAAPRDYTRNSSVTDKYSRGEGRLEDDRNELFAGYNPEKSRGSGRFFDGPDLNNGRPPPNPGEETEEDVEGIKQQTRFLKQESANSTRNALRLAREAEETARNTLGRLGDQSEKLANTERHLDVAKGHSQRADDRTDELKKLNRSIFRPAITFNKDAKRAAQEAKVQARYQEERDEREKAMMEVRETQNRIGRAGTYGRGDNEDEEGIGGSGSGRFRTQEQLQARKAARGRYQFEATASDDEIEDEIDDNLDEIGDMAKRLKAIALATGQELDKQNDRIERITGKTDGLDSRLVRNTDRLKRIK